MGTKRSKATENSPADITVTNRDDAQDTVLTLDFLKSVEEKHPGSVFEAADETIQNTDTTEDQPPVQAEPVGEGFILDAISKILKRLEALEDLNLEERLRIHNTRAPFKI